MRQLWNCPSRPKYVSVFAAAIIIGKYWLCLKLNYDLWPDLATASFIDLSIPPRQTRRRCYRKFDRDPALFANNYMIRLQLRLRAVSCTMESHGHHVQRRFCLLWHQCNIRFMCLALRSWVVTSKTVPNFSPKCVKMPHSKIFNFLLDLSN